MSSNPKTDQTQMPEQDLEQSSLVETSASESSLLDEEDIPIRGAHIAPQARVKASVEDSQEQYEQVDPVEQVEMAPSDEVATIVYGDGIDDMDDLDEIEEAPAIVSSDAIDDIDDLDEVEEVQTFVTSGIIDDMDDLDEIEEVRAIASSGTANNEMRTEPEVASNPSSAMTPATRPHHSTHASGSPQATSEMRSAPIPASEAVNAPGRNEMPVENRANSDTATGSNDHLSWGGRSDVGLVRGHNEDAFLIKAPLFAVCDGMGGHAAGEVASGIAVRTIADNAPAHADEILLGAAVEAANAAVLEGAENGTGKPGMGCTATCIYIENHLMSVAHVGDSRVYLLHGGTLVRITHDHSYVEELVDAGEITADEARVHPSRSIITRALGSDPDMYADHFTLEVSSGDRVILCSDGLSSMVSDKDIEELAVSSVTPQAAADTLVSAALTAGGHDNVTVVVVDVEEDGIASIRRRQRIHGIQAWFVVVALAILAMVGVVWGLVRNSWYVGNNGGTVGIYRGISDEFLGIPLGQLVETSSVQVIDLPEAVQHQLDDGISVTNEEDARHTVERYRDQIDSDKTHAAQVAQATQNAANVKQQQQQPQQQEQQEPAANEEATGQEATEEQPVNEGEDTNG
ncbi:MAG: Stp1/IreP family PP2C-type Ser/Thr phosphatase [Coriobacteriales bacterium]|nr:Stp1/IreP family PP2C-type Ser/Thr phosphatase [Coriobacteriales bacterium]